MVSHEFSIHGIFIILSMTDLTDRLNWLLILPGNISDAATPVSEKVDGEKELRLL